MRGAQQTMRRSGQQSSRIRDRRCAARCSTRLLQAYCVLRYIAAEWRCPGLAGTLACSMTGDVMRQASLDPQARRCITRRCPTTAS